MKLNFNYDGIASSHTSAKGRSVIAFKYNAKWEILRLHAWCRGSFTWDIKETELFRDANWH